MLVNLVQDNGQIWFDQVYLGHFDWVIETVDDLVYHIPGKKFVGKKEENQM